MAAAIPVGDLSPGRHAFVAFGSDAEQLHVLVEFVRSGLEKGERVLYFAHRLSPFDVEQRLRRRGIDTERAMAEQRLVLDSARGAYLADGRFDASATKRGWFNVIAEMLALGFDVMRVAADMSWAASPVPGNEDLPKYERSIAEVFATGRVVGLCEFDTRVFPAETIAMYDALHSCEVDVHPVAASAMLHVQFASDGEGAIIGGEVDVYNHAEFVDALMTIADSVDGDVHLDLSGLRFIDAAGLASIVRCAARLRWNRHIVLHNVQPHIERVMALFQWGRIPQIRIAPHRR